MPETTVKDKYLVYCSCGWRATLAASFPVAEFAATTHVRSMVQLIPFVDSEGPYHQVHADILNHRVEFFVR